MKHLKCHDVSGLTCGFEVTGRTDEEVMRKLTKHGKMYHSEIMKKMSDKDMAKKMHKKITED